MKRAVLGILLLCALFGNPVSTEAQETKVRIAEPFRGQLYLPRYAAIAKGFAKEQGLSIEVTPAGGSDRAGALMLAGQVDVALAGPEVAIFIYNGESSDKPQIFATLVGTDGYFLGSRQKKENFAWSMLNGAKILGTRPGSTPTLYLSYLLSQKGVNKETIASIITNIGQQAREGAFLSGDMDFATFSEPAMTKLVTSGRIHYIGSVGKEIGRADYTVLMAKKSWLAKNKDTAQRLTNAIAQAQAWIKTAPAKEIAETVASFFPGLTIEASITTIERFRSSGAPIWLDTPEVSVEGLKKFQEIMVAGGVLPAGKTLAYETIVAAEFAKNIPSPKK